MNLIEVDAPVILVLVNVQTSTSAVWRKSVVCQLSDRKARAGARTDVSRMR